MNKNSRFKIETDSKENFRLDRLDDTSGLSITSKTTNRWKSGKNEKKMKSLAAEG